MKENGHHHHHAVSTGRQHGCLK